MTCPGLASKIASKNIEKNNPHLNKHPQHMIYMCILLWLFHCLIPILLATNKAVSNLWFFWEPFGATLWEPLENRFSKNRTPPRVPRPWLDWKFHYCGKNFWQTSFCHKKCYVKNCFLRVIPTLTHYSDIVSDIPSGRIYILLPI